MKINIKIVTTLFLGRQDIGTTISFVEPETYLMTYPYSLYHNARVAYLSKSIYISHIKDLRKFNRKFIIINKLLKEIEHR